MVSELKVFGARKFEAVVRCSCQLSGKACGAGVGDSAGRSIGCVFAKVA